MAPKELVERLNTVREGMEAGLDDWPIASQIWEYKEAATAIEQLHARVRELEAENARLRTVPMKYRRMQFNAQLQDENQELRAQLATAQEQIANETAEAIAKFVAFQRNDIPATGIEFAEVIRNGAWKEFK